MNQWKSSSSKTGSWQELDLADVMPVVAFRVTYGFQSQPSIASICSGSVVARHRFSTN